MNDVKILENELIEMVDTMVGCACDLNTHNWDTLMKVRDSFKTALHEKLCKIGT